MCAKVTGPLFSLDARNTVGKAIVYSSWKGINYVRARVVPKNPNSDPQKAIRALIKAATQLWSTSGDGIDAAYKLAYATAAKGQAYSGFNLYVKDSVGKNGGSDYEAPFVKPTAPGDNEPA